MVAPLGVRFVKNARNVRCCRAFFSIREGYGVIMARLAGSGGFFYGSLQTIHLIHFWGGVRPEGSEGGVSGLPVRFACRTGRFRWGRKAKAGGVGKPAASRVPAGCLAGGWMVRKV